MIKSKRKLNSYIIGGLLIAAAMLAAYYLYPSGNSSGALLFGQVTRGSISLTITSSGTLQALSTVEVGTQVSGRIAKLYADFNDEVKKGQLLAVLDTTTLASQVRDAEASLLRARADNYQKSKAHERNSVLYEKKYLSEQDYIQSLTERDNAKAALQSAESAFERAKINLSYAYIYAPISGKVLNRSIEQGQTVAANFSAPTLFTIAEDLSSMRILASVDESDIGSIALDQKVTFTVQAYDNRTFEGRVSQIRLNAVNVSNVVNYTVIILAENKDRALLPGMTATVDFHIDSRENVLLVPNSALRYKPSETLLHESMQKIAAPGKLPAAPPQSKQANDLLTDNTTRGCVWIKDSSDIIRSIFVITGLTDGKNTEIVMADGLISGTQVITGEEETVESGSSNSSAGKNLNSITKENKQGGGMPPPPPF